MSDSMDQKCKSCRFWQHQECRRFPPVFTGSKDLKREWSYPLVGSENPQCGEFEAEHKSGGRYP